MIEEKIINSDSVSIIRSIAIENLEKEYFDLDPMFTDTQIAVAIVKEYNAYHNYYNAKQADLEVVAEAENYLDEASEV